MKDNNLSVYKYLYCISKPYCSTEYKYRYAYTVAYSYLYLLYVSPLRYKYSHNILVYEDCLYMTCSSDTRTVITIGTRKWIPVPVYLCTCTCCRAIQQRQNVLVHSVIPCLLVLVAVQATGVRVLRVSDGNSTCTCILPVHTLYRTLPLQVLRTFCICMYTGMYSCLRPVRYLYQDTAGT